MYCPEFDTKIDLTSTVDQAIVEGEATPVWIAEAREHEPIRLFLEEQITVLLNP